MYDHNQYKQNPSYCQQNSGWHPYLSVDFPWCALNNLIAHFDGIPFWKTRRDLRHRWPLLYVEPGWHTSVEHEGIVDQDDRKNLPWLLENSVKFRKERAFPVGRVLFVNRTSLVMRIQPERCRQVSVKNCLENLG